MTDCLRWHGTCFILAWMLLPSCAAQTNRDASTPTPTDERARAEHTVVTNEESLPAGEILARADQALAAERFEVALADYERLLRAARWQQGHQLDPSDREWIVRALWGAGTCHDMLGEREAALARYLELIERFADLPQARTAGVRAVRLLVHLERAAEASPHAERLLGPALRGEGFGPLEQVALLSAVALARVERGDDDGAERMISRGRDIVERHGFERADVLPRDLAQLFYALAEVRRLRAERLVFEPPFDDFPLRLEERCQLLLDAQSAYSESMRAHDAHWSAMAGFRVGELYQRLHEDLMRVPPPAAADDDARRALFEGAMRLRYAILLDKARTMLSHTLAMVERTGHSTPWAGKARVSLEAIEEAIRREQASLDRLPYSRAELQAALDELARRAQQSP